MYHQFQFQKHPPSRRGILSNFVPSLNQSNEHFFFFSPLFCSYFISFPFLRLIFRQTSMLFILLIVVVLFLLDQCFCKSLLFFYDYPQLPEYLKDTFEQARLFHPLPLPIRFLTTPTAISRCVWCASVLSTYSIQIEFVEQQPSAQFQRFSQVVPFTSGAGLFGFTRFFHIEAMISRLNLTDVVQVECDNLLYVNVLDLIVPRSRNWRRFGQLAVTPCGKAFATAGVMYIRNAAALRHMNEYAIAWCRLTRAQIASLMPSDSGTAAAKSDWGSFQSEMHFLGYYHRVFGSAFLSHLPVLPFGKFGPPLAGYVFDPASYGQLLGSNWAGDHHVVGRELIYNQLAVCWRPLDGANQTYTPFVRDLGGNEWPLANLHIYSKSLAPWRSARVAVASDTRRTVFAVTESTTKAITEHGINYVYD
jgi:hypothetical protein